MGRGGMAQSEGGLAQTNGGGGTAPAWNQKDRLTREVLKWLQGLDLSFSVKNIRRDAANGFMIAEMFARYFPAEIQMHIFDNGASLARRADNWQQLERFFRKHGVPIEQPLIDATINCVPGGAVAVVEAAYKFLTNRSIPERPPQLAAEAPPSQYLSWRSPPRKRSPKKDPPQPGGTQVGASGGADKAAGTTRQRVPESSRRVSTSAPPAGHPTAQLSARSSLSDFPPVLFSPHGGKQALSNPASSRSGDGQQMVIIGGGGSAAFNQRGVELGVFSEGGVHDRGGAEAAESKLQEEIGRLQEALEEQQQYAETLEAQLRSRQLLRSVPAWVRSKAVREQLGKVCLGGGEEAGGGLSAIEEEERPEAGEGLPRGNPPQGPPADERRNQAALLIQRHQRRIMAKKEVRLMEAMKGVQKAEAHLREVLEEMGLNTVPLAS